MIRLLRRLTGRLTDDQGATTAMTDQADTRGESLASRLTPMQFDVTQRAGTEPAFTGEYWNLKDDGMYNCVVCGEPLFESDTKYDSGSGWPSFYQPLADAPIDEEVDRKFGMVRTEVKCGKCGAHLGHLFPDGPQPTGLRYCINSAALAFDKLGDETAG